MKIYAKDGTRLRDKDYLKWIRGCGCMFKDCTHGSCFGDVVAAHGKPLGMGIKGSDRMALPLCFYHHQLEHAGKLPLTNVQRDKIAKRYNKMYDKII